MFEIFAGLTMTLGGMVMIGLLAVGVGYRGHLSAPAPLLRHFSWGVVLITVSMAARLTYWDLFFTWLELHDPAAWKAWTALTGGTNINIVFLIPTLIGVYHSLKALHLLVPEAERHRWRWWSVCLYPVQIFIKGRE